MERPFIFFHTGTGLLVAILALPVAACVGTIAMYLMPDITILQFLAFIIGLSPVFWIPFRLDLQLARKRHSDKKQGEKHDPSHPNPRPHRP